MGTCIKCLGLINHGGGHNIRCPDYVEVELDEKDKPVIHVKVKNVQGIRRVYPDCPKAQLFADIAGNKTLVYITLHWIRQLGYRVSVHGGVDLPD